MTHHIIIVIIYLLILLLSWSHHKENAQNARETHKSSKSSHVNVAHTKMKWNTKAKMKPSSCWFLWFMVRLEYISEYITFVHETKVFSFLLCNNFFPSSTSLSLFASTCNIHTQAVVLLLRKSMYFLVYMAVYFDPMLLYYTVHSNNSVSTCFAQKVSIQSKSWYTHRKREKRLEPTLKYTHESLWKLKIWFLLRLNCILCVTFGVSYTI